MPVNWPAFFALHFAATVDGIAQQVKDATQRRLPDGDGDGRTRVDDVHAADQAVGRAQGHAAHATASQVLLHFTGQADLDPLALMVDLDGVIDFREAVLGELGIKGRSDHLCDLSDGSRSAARCRGANSGR